MAEVPRDATNATEPQAGYQISGDATRIAAIKRLKKQQEEAALQKRPA